MKTIYTLLSLTLLAGVAHADDAPKAFKLAVGVSVPADGDVRKGTSDSGFALSAGYTLKSKSILDKTSGKVAVNADFLTNSGHGNRLSVTGLTYTETAPFSRTPKSLSAYGGLGLGIYQASLKVGGVAVNETANQAALTRAFTPNTTTQTTNATRLGGKFIVGVANRAGQFFEATYHIVGKVDGVRADTVGITLGSHF